MAILKIDDLDLYYRVSGQGPPLILIMGFTANSDWWPANFVAQLARHYCVYSVDNRCAGRTSNGTKRFTINQAADDLAGFMDALSIDSAHIFGISMGGMIAQAMAIRHADRIDRLVLGCTMPRPITGFIAALKDQSKLVLQYLINPKVRARPWVVNIMFSRAYLEKNAQTTNEFMEMAVQAKITARGWWRQLLAMIAFNAKPGLKKIHRPTLVISGDVDLLVAPVHSRRLAKALPNATLITMPGLGHAFVGEAPEDCAQHLLRFFKAQKNPDPKK